MCGIAGIASNDPPAADELERMSRALAHRGPDDRGVYVEPGVALVHRRLSILDLTGGHQPMASDDGLLHIVFNGEIYNFRELRSELAASGTRFRTESDTEVLLALYREHGIGFVRQLRGMFAFAIWDARDRSLVLARDHYGQKPLFYAEVGGAFLFASEIKSLLASGRIEARPDLDTLYQFLGLRYCPGDRTLFAGVKKLPPATWMIVRDGKIESEVFWDPSPRAPMEGSEQEVVAGLDERLSESVRLHLVSDVPVGAFLSGGVDSSIVTAMAAKEAEAPIPTFSVGADAADFSELPHARRVARHCGTDHHEFTVETSLFERLPDLIWHMEEPGDPHGVGILSLSRLARESVKVALGGDGADEQFAGYTRHRAQLLLAHYSRLPAWLRRRVVAPLIRLLPESFSYESIAAKARWMNQGSFHTPGGQHYHGLVFFRFPDDAKQRIFTPRALASVARLDSSQDVVAMFEGVDAETTLDRILYVDRRTRMAEHYLLIADRMSMAFGLELRCPFLDPKLGEYVAAIPASLKIRGRRQKVALRSVGETLLPAEIFDRPKRGFAFPMARWFRGPLAPFVERVARESRMVQEGIFREDSILEFLHEHVAGRVDHSFRLWMIVNCEVWYRLFIDGADRDEMKTWMRDCLETSGVSG